MLKQQEGTRQRPSSGRCLKLGSWHAIITASCYLQAVIASEDLKAGREEVGPICNTTSLICQGQYEVRHKSPV